MRKIVYFWLVVVMLVSVFSGAYANNTTNLTEIINNSNNSTDSLNSSVIYVSTNGNDNNNGLTPKTSKRSVQNAIDTVPENGTVNIGFGVYHECLKVNKSVSLVGAKEGVVIDGDYKDSCIIIEEDCNVSLEAFTIENAMNTGIISHGDVNLSGVVVQKNGGENNGGIINTGTMTITNSKITENNVKGDNAGIYNTGTLTIKNSEVKNNQASKNVGGIYNNGTLTLTDSQVNDNKAKNSTSGIWSNGTLTITNSQINNNNNCGVLSYGNSSISNSEIKKNGGDGVKNTGGNLSITNSQINNNKANGVISEHIANNYGKEIVIYASLTIDNSKIESNKGAGVWNWGDASITNCRIQKNDKTGLGNGYPGFMNVTNSSIILNHGEWGGGINNNGGKLVVVNCVIEGNRANYKGGGICNQDRGGRGGRSTINGSSICGNRVTESMLKNLWDRFANHFKVDDYDSNFKDGGGIDNDGDLEVNDCYIVDNVATKEGGGIHCWGLGTTRINGSVIRQNKAINGGGIYICSINSISLCCSEVKYNVAFKGGGVYCKYKLIYDDTSKIEKNWFKNFH
jgi:hypothetical protein